MMTIILAVKNHPRAGMGHSRADKRRAPRQDRRPGCLALPRGRDRPRGRRGRDARRWTDSRWLLSPLRVARRTRGEAVERALYDGGQAMAAVAESPYDPLAAVIDAYLSISHRDNLGTSCAVTTLARDVAHSSPRARTAYTNQVGIYIDMLVRLLPPGPVVGRRRSPPCRRWSVRSRWRERSMTRPSRGRSSPRRRRR